MDSPSQNALGIPALTKRDGNSIVIDMPIVGGLHRRTRRRRPTITSAWHQNGMDFRWC